MSYSWFRFYHKMVNDPKVLRLAPAERWAWVALLCLASAAEKRGVVEVIEGVGYKLNELARDLDVAPEVVAGMLRAAADLGMIALDDAGVITITHWQEQQYDKPSDRPERTRERKRAQRDRQAESDAGHADVTPASRPGHAADTDTDTDADTKDLVVVVTRATPPMLLQGAEAGDAGLGVEDLRPLVAPPLVGGQGDHEEGDHVGSPLPPPKPQTPDPNPAPPTRACRASWRCGSTCTASSAPWRARKSRIGWSGTAPSCC